MGCGSSVHAEQPKFNTQVTRFDIVGRENQDFSSKYTILNMLGKINKINSVKGSGAFGQVSIVENNKTKEKFAAKFIKKDTSMDIAVIQKEIDILKKLSHPNIVKPKHFVIIMELCTGGELFDVIEKLKVFSEQDAANITQTLLMAVNYLHKQKIAHRDIKPENIMMTDNKFNNMKLVDFGTAIKSNKDTIINQKVGTAYYMSPEVIKEKNYTMKCDIFSWYPPFNGDTNQEIMDCILNQNLFFDQEFDDKSPQLIDLLKKMLEKNEKKRISAEECLKHKWFKSHGSKENISNVEINKVANSMKKFHTNTKIQNAIWNFFTIFMSIEEEEKEIAKIFKSLDRNNDGTLSKSEIKDAFKHLNLLDGSTKNIDEMIEAMDLDKDGLIDYNEFLVATINKSKIVTTEKLKMAFNQLDVNSDGEISLDEFKSFFTANDNISHDQWLNMFEWKEGQKLTFQDFEKLITKMEEQNSPMK